MGHSAFTLVNAIGVSLLLALETRAPAFRRGFFDARRIRRNLAFLVASVSAAFLLHRMWDVLAPLLPKAPWRPSLWLQLPLVFLLGELLNWLIHCAKHANGTLWRFHCQHHKEDQYSVWLTAHTYAPEVLLSGSIIIAVVIASGFSRLAFDSYLLFYSLVNLYQHSALPYSLGWLDKLIISPAHHRQHHSGALVNFGSTLTIWDCVFRTVRWPTHRAQLLDPPAIDTTPEPFGFVQEMLYPWRPSQWVEQRVAALDER